MDVDKIIAEMPEAESPYSCGTGRYESGLTIGWNTAREAQCRLLAEAGYRPVPSVEEIKDKLRSIFGDYEFEIEAVIIHHWLLGDKEGKIEA